MTDSPATEWNAAKFRYTSKACSDDSVWKYTYQEPRHSGKLQVSDEPPHKIAWCEYGNPDGEPVFFFHGGPGGASTKDDMRYFDPARYRIVVFDQRGCGQSEPNVVDDPKNALRNNTTGDLIEDVEKLRQHLGVKGKMHVLGGSWGSTLALSYAIQHPDHVHSLALRGIFLCRRQDLDIFYQGNAAVFHEDPPNRSLPGVYTFFPKEWAEYVNVIEKVSDRQDMIAAYAKIFAMDPQNDAERALQERAARAWTRWEDATSHLSQDMKAFYERERNKTPSDFKGDIAMARIENHFFMNGCFLGGSGEKNRDQNWILENVDKIKDIPIRIVQGQYDMVCPRQQADDLHKALEKAGAKDVQFELTQGSGHSRKERENIAVMTDFMDHMPKMTLRDKHPAMAAYYKEEPNKRSWQSR